jgi:hypothetical protein
MCMQVLNAQYPSISESQVFGGTQLLTGVENFFLYISIIWREKNLKGFAYSRNYKPSQTFSKSKHAVVQEMGFARKIMLFFYLFIMLNVIALNLR